MYRKILMIFVLSLSVSSATFAEDTDKASVEKKLNVKDINQNAIKFLQEKKNDKAIEILKTAYYAGNYDNQTGVFSSRC